MSSYLYKYCKSTSLRTKKKMATTFGKQVLRTPHIYNILIDPDLAAHLANGPFKEKYLSPIRQNEMINILGEQITHSIVSQCNRAGAFALLADECTDKSTTKQMSLCLCFFFTTCT